MKVIVGLGNPGPQYERTLHNVGFQTIDIIAEQLGIQNWKSSFNANISQGIFENQKFLLLKPQTFMNLSGQAVSRCIQYYKVSLDQVLVVFDDFNLDAGVLRFREAGGAGGHNGIKSIIHECGLDNFRRLKIGIGHPGDRNKITSHVLGQPSKDDAIAIDLAIEKCCPYIKDFILNKPIQISN